MLRDLWKRLTEPSDMGLTADTEQMALAVLMVRLARADEDYSASEISRIDRVLSQRYGLSPAQAADLRREAEAEEAVAPDTVRYTRALKGAVPLEGRIALLEALWAVALADGGRDAQEDRMMRMIGPLLGVTDVESGLARQRVTSQA